MIILLLAIIAFLAAHWRRATDQVRELERQRELDSVMLASVTMQLLRRDGEVRNLRRLTHKLMGGGGTGARQ